MATKNLARTVIEGGRTGWMKFKNREFTRRERHNARLLLRGVAHDPMLFDHIGFDPRQREYLDQADKLNPVRRWLHSQCGNVWSRVYAEVFQKFNTRTIPGQHIVYDHLLGDVEVSMPQRYAGFFVDDGILKFRPRTRPRWERDLRSFEPEISVWLGGRLVGMRGEHLYWFIPVENIFWMRGLLLNGRKMTYKQGSALSFEDKKYFLSMTKKAQAELLARGRQYIPHLDGEESFGA